MKVLFKNVTKYTKENCSNFEKFHTNKYGKKEMLRIILGIIVLLYIVIFNIRYKNWFLILGIVVLALLLYWMENYRLNKEKKEKKKVKVFTFYFYENYMKVKYKKQFERLLYLNFHKVFETDQYFFLYTGEKNSLILNKEGFEIGTAEDFSKFIKAKCPFKYHKEKKH